eukprot:300753-Pyramimonas_sp.AAC.1
MQQGTAWAPAGSEVFNSLGSGTIEPRRGAPEHVLDIPHAGRSLSCHAVCLLCLSLAQLREPRTWPAPSTHGLQHHIPL